MAYIAATLNPEILKNFPGPVRVGKKSPGRVGERVPVRAWLWDIFGTPCNIVTTLGKVEQPELGEDWDQRDVISTLTRYYLKGKAEH